MKLQPPTITNRRQPVTPYYYTREGKRWSLYFSSQSNLPGVPTVQGQLQTQGYVLRRCVVEQAGDTVIIAEYVGKE